MLRVAVALALAGLAAPAALAAAQPAPRTARFSATVVVTVGRDWHAASTDTVDGCSAPLSLAGNEVLLFHSAQPSRVTATLTRAGLRWSGRLRALAGEFATSGSTVRETSDCNPDPVVTDCTEPQLQFAQGTLSLTRPAPGKLSLAGFAHEGQAAPRCIPTEAAPTEDAPLPAVAGALDERKVFAKRPSALVVTGSLDRLLTLAGDASGQMTEAVRWRLTLRRVPAL